MHGLYRQPRLPAWCLSITRSGPHGEQFAYLSFRCWEDYLYLSLLTVMCWRGSLGDEEWLALVNTKGRHLKRGSCWELNSEAQMTTQTTRGDLTSQKGLLPALSQPLCSPSQGMQRLLTFKEYHLPFPPDGAAFPKVSTSKPVYSEWSCSQPQDPPRGPITTWCMGSVPGHKSGICFGNFQRHQEVWTCTPTVPVAYFHQQTPNQRPGSQEQPLGYLRMGKAGWIPGREAAPSQSVLDSSKLEGKTGTVSATLPWSLNPHSWSKGALTQA